MPPFSTGRALRTSRRTLALVALAAVSAHASACSRGATPEARRRAPAPVVRAPEAGVDAARALDARAAATDAMAATDEPALPPVDALTRAAVVYGSCVPNGGMAGFFRDWFTHEGIVTRLTAAQIQCLATTGGGCEAVSACLHTRVTAAGPCEPSCAGARWTHCEGALRFELDCAALGLVCSPAGGCLDAPVRACDPATFVPRCEGGRPTYCERGVVQRGPLCASMGLACGAAPDRRGTTCRGRRHACRAEYAGPSHVMYDGEECEGNVLEACANGGTTLRDCAAMGAGFGCREFEGESFCGRAAECLPDVRPVACEGPAVVFCNLGRIDRVDCRSLGFASCAPGASGGCVPTPFAR